ncbi:MAG: hypothetical protein ABI333_27920, partial [bacterium]
MKLTRKTIPALFVVLSILAAVPACKSKKRLDKSVDKLVTALVQNDYKAFEQMSHEKLVAKFPKSKFGLLSQSVNLLGKYKERTMKGIHARTGKVREGRYVLTFEKGKANLELTLVRGKLTAFLFSGDDIEAAMRKVRVQAFSKFEVGSFQFVDTVGNAKNNVFRVGETIRFRIAVHGLQLSGTTLKVVADLQVVDAQGKVVLDKPKLVDASLPGKPDDPPV